LPTCRCLYEMTPRIPNAHTNAKTPLHLKHFPIYIAFHEILIWWLPSFYMLLLVLCRCCWSIPHFLPLKKRFMCKLDIYIDGFKSTSCTLSLRQRQACFYHEKQKKGGKWKWVKNNNISEDKQYFIVKSL